jgi:hypothetical protein
MDGFLRFFKPYHIISTWGSRSPQEIETWMDQAATMEVGVATFGGSQVNM